MPRLTQRQVLLEELLAIVQQVIHLMVYDAGEDLMDLLEELSEVYKIIAARRYIAARKISAGRHLVLENLIKNGSYRSITQVNNKDCGVITLFNVENFLANPEECLKSYRKGKIDTTIDIDTYRQSIKDRLQTQYPDPEKFTLNRVWLSIKWKYISKLAPWVQNADIKEIVKNPDWTKIREEIFRRLVLDTQVKVLNQRISEIVTDVNQKVQKSVEDKQRKHLQVPGSGYYGPRVSEILMNLVLRMWNKPEYIWNTRGVSFIQSIVVPELIFQFILHDLDEWGHLSCDKHASFLQQNWNLPELDVDIAVTDIEELEEEETRSVECGGGKKRKVTSSIHSQQSIVSSLSPPLPSETSTVRLTTDAEAVTDAEDVTMGDVSIDEMASVVLKKAPRALIVAWDCEWNNALLQSDHPRESRGTPWPQWTFYVQDPKGSLSYKDKRDGPATVCEKFIENMIRDKYRLIMPGGVKIVPSSNIKTMLETSTDIILRARRHTLVRKKKEGVKKKEGKVKKRLHT
ncbi:hypothetical protein EV426DRAFT_711157 [Tirmania nivea]|nr:hypothetical protein EV426DRAFT_711157 [Tirmania nivea]